MISQISSRRGNRLWCRIAGIALLSLWLARASTPARAGEDENPRVDGLGRLDGQIRLIGEPPKRDILARLRNGLDRDQLKQFQDQTLPPLQDRLSAGLFGPRSLFGKTQNSMLTSEQKERLKARFHTTDEQSSRRDPAP